MAYQASSIEVNAIEPQSGTTLTIGQSGQNVVVNADSIKNNVLKDAGGNAIFTSNGSGTLSGVNSGFGSAQVLISTETVTTAVSEINFTSGITSTYKEYIFAFQGIKASASDPHFRFQVGSGYAADITSTVFKAYNGEGGGPSLAYVPNDDQPPTPVYQVIARNVTTDVDGTCVGELHLFNPASAIYVKNFYCESSNNGAYVMQTFAAGYIMTTTAITQVSFNLTSGNIAAGTIKMYGIK